MATVTFQMQSYFPGAPGVEGGYELIALVDTTQALAEKDKIKHIQIEAGRGPMKLDNKEDVEVEPGDSVGAVFVSKKQKGLLPAITGIDLDLKKVARWQRVEQTGTEIE